MRITRTATTEGVRSTLDYRYRGGRYRPVLGYNLTSDQEHEAMGQILARIQAHVGGDAGDPGSRSRSSSRNISPNSRARSCRRWIGPQPSCIGIWCRSSGCVRCAR